MSTIGRPRVAVAYIWITFFVSGTVFIQGFLFGAFYSGRGADYIQFHGWVGEDAAFITIVLVVLAFWARFPGELRVGWWTLGWSILWNVQAHIFGRGIADVRWFEMVHIPLAIFLVVSGMYLAQRCLNAKRAATPDEPVPD